MSLCSSQQWFDALIAGYGSALSWASITSR
jgi:hypothetical protein